MYRMITTPRGRSVLLISLFTAALLEGSPNRGDNCASCHTSTRTDRMRVTPQELKIDLGTQLDGQVRGSLNAFAAEPGQIVTLKMDVLNTSGTWSAVLKGMEKGGQELDQLNKLSWSQAGNAGWTQYGTTRPYLATATASGGTTGTRDILFTVVEGTPPDTYELVFAIAGVSSGRFYQEERFYLEVTAPQQQWAGFTVDPNGNVDTGAFLGWINVANAPWIFIFDLANWAYLREEWVSATGGWTWLPR